MRGNLELLQGGDDLKSYQSSESVVRQFCSHCGSSMFWSRAQGEFAEWVSVALGTLDTHFTSDNQKHVELTSKASWYEMADQRPKSRA